MLYREVLKPLIRTGVLSAVGAVAAFFASQGVELSGETRTALVAGLTGLLGSLYYLVARVLERRYPHLGRLLGAKADNPAEQ